jgi:hypothetical protein
MNCKPFLYEFPFASLIAKANYNTPRLTRRAANPRPRSACPLLNGFPADVFLETMKRNLLNCLAASALIFAAACGKTETSSQTATGSDTAKKIEIEYSYNEKPKFVARMKEELAEANSELRKLSEKIANSTEKAANDAKPKLERLKEKTQNLDAQIAKAESATESTWDDVKAGSQKALDETKETFNEARAWLSEKIAP